MKLLALKVEFAHGERAKTYLLRHQLLNRGYRVFRKNAFIYFPILGNGEGLKGIGSLIHADFRHSNIEKAAKFESRGTKSYDVLGNIAVIDNTAKANELAKHIMSLNKNVKTVVAKAGAVHGIYRTRSYKVVAGEHTFVARYKENNCIFLFDIRRVFFSPRLSFERKRISESVKDGENVMVMFAGVGPFAIEIAKAKRANVVAIELNKVAYQYMLKNIALNKVDVKAVNEDVATAAKKYEGFADRIVMPLPKDAYSFLDSAFTAAKDRCIIHYYAFGSIEHAAEENIKKIRYALKGRAAVEVIKSREVRPYSAKEVEVVIDFKIKKLHKI